MKQTFLPLLGILALGLTSCDLGGGETTSNSTYSTVNLVTELGTGRSVLSSGQYSFNLNITQQTATVATTDLLLPSNGPSAVKHIFTTDPVPFVEGVFQNGCYFLKILNAQGKVDNDPALTLQGFQARVTDYVYKTSDEQSYINYTLGLSVASIGNPAVFCDYSIGGQYSVRTVPKVAFYKGKTTTTVAGSGLPTYNNEDMLYGVFFHEDLTQADVVIYDAKFAEAAPALSAVVLKDLPVTCADKTYTISAKNVIPSVVEGSGLTPNQRFPFNEFTLTATGTYLHAAVITYQVAENYSARFYGTYLPEDVLTQN